jgi:hypothetical protein
MGHLTLAKPLASGKFLIDFKPVLFIAIFSRFVNSSKKALSSGVNYGIGRSSNIRFDI